MTNSYGAMEKRGLEINILGVYSVPDLFLRKRKVAVLLQHEIDAFPRQKQHTESFFMTDKGSGVHYGYY
jgi:hypothetical protein